MDDPPALQANRQWRMAVWSLRIGFGGLLVVGGGLIALAMGGSPWLLAAGVIIWLLAAGVTVIGVLRCHGELTEPRPGLWPMRFMLLRDTIRARPRPEAS